MERLDVWQVFKETIIEIFPDFSTKVINESDSLKDLGANSIDRVEIIMLVMSRLRLKIPLVAFASAKNMAGLVSIFHDELQRVS